VSLCLCGDFAFFRILLELNLELTSNGCSQAIEKLPEARAAEIILHVTRVEVISNVKDGDTDAHLVFLEHRDAKAFGDLSVEREECGEASRLITPTHEIELLINS